jgi:hypothetical protein
MSGDEPYFKQEILDGEIAKEVYGRDIDIPTDEEIDEVMEEFYDDIDEENSESGGSEEYVQEAREIADQISL